MFSRAVAFAFVLIAAAAMSEPAAAIDSIDAAARPSPAIASASQPNALLSIDQNRSTVVDRIVRDWGDTLAASNGGLDKEQLRALLTGLRSDHLLAASLAGTLDGLRNAIALAQTSTANATGSIRTKALGDTAADLAYTPVIPCRIVDTRLVGGAFAQGGETRSFHAFLASGTFATQGGAASNCAIPANPAVVAVNIATINGEGFLTAWPYNVAQPVASTLNPAPGQILANGVLVPVCQPNCTREFSVFTFGAQVVIDIVGFFKAPGAPSAGFVDNGDGTVTDRATGLMWEKKLAIGDPACVSLDQDLRDARCQQNQYTWSATSPFTEPTGTLYSDFLEKLNDLKTPDDGIATPCFAGHCDWRIPTIGELRSILLAPHPSCNAIPCVDPIFGPTMAGLYASSSSSASAPGRAWFINFAIAFVNTIGTLENAVFHARAVRGGR